MGDVVGCGGRGPVPDQPCCGIAGAGSKPVVGLSVCRPLAVKLGGCLHSHSVNTRGTLTRCQALWLKQ